MTAVHTSRSRNNAGEAWNNAGCFGWMLVAGTDLPAPVPLENGSRGIFCA